MNRQSISSCGPHQNPWVLAAAPLQGVQTLVLFQRHGATVEKALSLVTSEDRGTESKALEEGY